MMTVTSQEQHIIGITPVAKQDQSYKHRDLRPLISTVKDTEAAILMCVKYSISFNFELRTHSV
jgi:hypothetical protein